MKKFILVILLFLSFINITNWNDDNLNWLNWLNWLKDSQLWWLTQIQEDLNKNVDLIQVEKKNDLVQVFCDKFHLTKTWERKFTTPKENKKIIETYLNNYGIHLIKNSWLSARTISNDVLWMKSTKTTTNETWEKIKNKYFWQSSKKILNIAEKECLQFRADNPTNSEKIDHIYEQVRFYASYYKTYHEDLTKWIIPWFIIWLIEAINVFIFYAIMLSVGNIIARTIILVIWESKEYSKNQWKLFNAFWYFILLFLIKIWVIGSLITFIWFDWLNLIKMFFFY